jgi:cation diffusion facilitator CzcD-associated flavoprotein CzcO
VGAEWSSEEARWTVQVERTDTSETLQLTCSFLFTCTGYYRYDQGYTPDFPGIERFGGEVVHPQFWPEDADYAGKRVVVIGSGATAVTLIPALAERAAHVTMLQRSPSYVISLPSVDPLARLFTRVLPAGLAYRVTRAKNALLAILIWTFSRRRPRAMRRLIRSLTRRQLPPGFDVDTHFNPRYDPWDQRMCVIPDNDLFAAISSGRVSVVTDRVETFTETGLRLGSGAELEADLVVTATGLALVPLGGIRLAVDGREVDLADTFAYRGMQVSGVPNLAFAFGYINQSWTLGADLTSLQVCRLLDHMDRHGYATVTPRHPGADAPAVPFAELNSGYIRRGIAHFPKQTTAEPWRREQNYAQNRRAVLRSPLDDPALEFSRAVPAKVAA